jgi:hypothetical protein
MKKEISAPAAAAIIAALVLLAVVGGMLWNRAANPVMHIRSGDSFDMKTGRVIRSGNAPGSAAQGAGAPPSSIPKNE